MSAGDLLLETAKEQQKISTTGVVDFWLDLEIQPLKEQVENLKRLNTLDILEDRLRCLTSSADTVRRVLALLPNGVVDEFIPPQPPQITRDGTMFIVTWHADAWRRLVMRCEGTRVWIEGSTRCDDPQCNAPFVAHDTQEFLLEGDNKECEDAIVKCLGDTGGCLSLII